MFVGLFLFVLCMLCAAWSVVGLLYCVRITEDIDRNRSRKQRRTPGSNKHQLHRFHRLHAFAFFLCSDQRPSGALHTHDVVESVYCCSHVLPKTFDRFDQESKSCSSNDAILTNGSRRGKSVSASKPTLS